MTYGFITWMDHSQEKATMSFNLDQLLADGSNYPAITAAFTAVMNAVEAVTLGNIIEWAIVADRTRVTNAIPADTSRREQKWLVRYQDDDTKKVYRLEIPMSDVSSMPFATGTDFVDVNSVDAEVTGLLSAVNTHVKSPTGGDATVLTIEDVGRNT